MLSEWHLLCSDTCCPAQLQGTPLQHARPVTATRLTEVPLQSHEQKKSIATVEPLVSLRWSNSHWSLACFGTSYGCLLGLQGVLTISLICRTQGSMEWYQASDPQPQYLVVPTTAAQHSSDDSSHRSHGHGPAAVQRTVNNIVALRTTADAMDVTVLEREIGWVACWTARGSKHCGARIAAQCRAWVQPAQAKESVGSPAVVVVIIKRCL